MADSEASTDSTRHGSTPTIDDDSAAETRPTDAEDPAAGTMQVMLVAGYTIGFGVGGLIDVLVMHQILQVHHTVSGWYDPSTLEGLRTNVFADGLLGTALLLIVLAGVGLLFYAGERPAVHFSRRAFLGSLFVGWGVFNVVDDIANHRLLEAHHVVHGPNSFWWNTGFLLASLGLILLGWWLIRTAQPGESA